MLTPHVLCHVSLFTSKNEAALSKLHSEDNFHKSQAQTSIKQAMHTWSYVNVLYHIWTVTATIDHTSVTTSGSSTRPGSLQLCNQVISLPCDLSFQQEGNVNVCQGEAIFWAWVQQMAHHLPCLVQFIPTQPLGQYVHSIGRCACYWLPFEKPPLQHTYSKHDIQPWSSVNQER